MKIARCPIFINFETLEVCDLPLGETVEIINRRWICSKHGLIGGDKVVNWKYDNEV